jgi:hypothetical protein
MGHRKFDTTAPRQYKEERGLPNQVGLASPSKMDIKMSEMQLSWQAIEKASIVLSFMKRSNDIIKIP